MTQDRVQQLFKAAFDQPRDPRSPEYKAGVLASLAFRFNGVPVQVPYPIGTAAADAYFSGLNEGNRIWRDATGQ